MASPRERADGQTFPHLPKPPIVVAPVMPQGLVSWSIPEYSNDVSPLLGLAPPLANRQRECQRRQSYGHPSQGQ